MTARLIAGVDVGGTFTDVVLFDPDARTLSVTKVPSTPADQSDGVRSGLLVVLPDLGPPGQAGARNDGLDQYDAAGERRPRGDGHHPRLSRRSGDRTHAPHAAKSLRSDLYASAAAGAAHAALRGLRAPRGRRIDARRAGRRRAGRRRPRGARCERRSDRDLLPARACQRRARSAREGGAATRAARRLDHDVGRGRARIPRIRALLDDRDQRLPVAGDGSLHVVAEREAR